LFCPNHVRGEVKAFKLEIKKKAIEDKLKAKAAAKQKALEEKAAKIEAKAAKAAKAKEPKPKAVKDPTLCLNCACTAVLKTGLRKGEQCGQKSVNETNLCKRHTPK
jgi:hypothetical protein